MKQILIVGRGGQGVVTAAELIAVAAFEDGKNAKAIPKFGPERRGAPVQASVKIDGKEIREYTHVDKPDFILVFEEDLLTEDLLKKFDFGQEMIFVVNSQKEFKSEERRKYFSVDADDIARKHLGAPIVNTTMLGAFAKASGLISLESVKKAVVERFGAAGEKNNLAVEEAYGGVKEW